MVTANIASRTYVEINSIDVTSYVKEWDYSVGIDDVIDEANLLMKIDVQSVVSFANGQEVIIKRGKTTGQEYHIFRGVLSTWSPKGAFLEIIAKEKIWQLERREVTNVFDNTVDDEAGEISAIAETLIETYGGLTADVESSGTINILTRFVCNYDKVYERLQALRKILNYILFYDPENDVVVFKNKGTNITPHVLKFNTKGTTNMIGIPKVDWDTEPIINSVTIVGGSVLERKTQTFSGTGSTDTFTLNSVPETIDIENPADTVKTLGVLDGSISGYDYYVDKINKKVIFVTNTTSGSDNVIIVYSAYVPVTAQQPEEDSIAIYGLSEDTFFFPDILNVADAEMKAQEILDRWSGPIPSINSLDIEQTPIPIRPGDSIKVEDEINGVNRFLTVNRITYRWPNFRDTVDIGQEPVADRFTIKEIQDRIAKLERREAQNVSFVNIIVGLSEIMRFKTEMEVLTVDTSFDGAWDKGFGDGSSKGDYTWDEAGGIWQDDYTNSEVTQSIVHQDDQWEEEFVDERFIISAETTATVDTNNNEVRFT